MKMAKKDRARLESVLEKLIKGQKYILADDTLVCKTKAMATTTLDFTNAQGQVCVSLNKEYGSELALLHTGIEQLKKILAEE